MKDIGSIIGEVIREGKTITHGVDENLERKIDMLIEEVRISRRSIINHWRVVIALMAISVTGVLLK